jgi:hypothetical protein
MISQFDLRLSGKKRPVVSAGIANDRLEYGVDIQHLSSIHSYYPIKAAIVNCGSPPFSVGWLCAHKLEDFVIFNILVSMKPHY